MRGTVAKVDERGQEPVDKDQPVHCPGANGPFPWPGLQSHLVPFMPQQTDLHAEFGYHLARQTCDPPIADDRCTRPLPHHTNMIRDQAPTPHLPTMHEVVRHCFLDLLT